ncbi:hypothetical protein AB0E01_44560 [Nocardia vinacea]|uniref:hypothetical protein n=1 Tax=Nocardia TaxID=1817 RepID=UPI0033F1BD07
MRTTRFVSPTGDVVYGMCTVGEAGRVLDKHAFATLGWRPGARLELTCLESCVLLARPEE